MTRNRAEPREELGGEGQGGERIDSGRGIIGEFKIFGQPGLGVLDDRDQVEAEEEVGGRATGALIEMMNGFLDGIGAFAAGAEVHDQVEAR